MNRKKIAFVFIISIISISSILGAAKPDSLFCSKFKPIQRSALFLFTAGYRMPVNENTIINSGRGLYFEGGLNPGILLSKKLVLGFYAGWAWKDKLWSTSFNSDFVNDYRSSLDLEPHFSSLDSTVILSSKELISNADGRSIPIPGCGAKSFNNFSIYYGIVLRLPYKYLPTLKLYTGVTRSHFQGDGNLATKDKEFNVFQLRRAMYGCELVVFRGLQRVSQCPGWKYPLSKNIGQLSLYYESCDFYNSSLYFYDGNQRTDIPLKKFMAPSFLEKYKTEVSWGFKLSFAIM
ncbi:MAG: hypothetical protein V4549_00820 [Bacteroidota bacterium]